MIYPVSFLTVFVIDHGIAESVDMAAGFPNHWMHENRRIDAHDIFVELGHGLPPVVFYVLFEFAAVLAVVVDGAEAVVDLAGGENKAVFLTM